MSSAMAPNVVIQRITGPSPEEVEEIIQVMIKGYEAEPFILHTPIPESSLAFMQPDDFWRTHHMIFLVPALLEGQVWVAKIDEAVVGVAMWTLPGHHLSDAPERKALAETWSKLISPEEVAFQARFKELITNERDSLFPELWRNTFHLQNLVTAPSARKKGAAGQLVKEMIRQARAEGQPMSLSTPTDANVSAPLSWSPGCADLPRRRFYAKLGFKTLWEKDIECPDGTRQKTIVMTQEGK